MQSVPCNTEKLLGSYGKLLGSCWEATGKLLGKSVLGRYIVNQMIVRRYIVNQMTAKWICTVGLSKKDFCRRRYSVNQMTAKRIAYKHYS